MLTSFEVGRLPARIGKYQLADRELILRRLEVPADKEKVGFGEVKKGLAPASRFNNEPIALLVSPLSIAPLADLYASPFLNPLFGRGMSHFASMVLTPIKGAAEAFGFVPGPEETDLSGRLMFINSAVLGGTTRQISGKIFSAAAPLIGRETGMRKGAGLSEKCLDFFANYCAFLDTNVLWSQFGMVERKLVDGYWLKLVKGIPGVVADDKYGDLTALIDLLYRGPPFFTVVDVLLADATKKSSGWAQLIPVMRRN